MSDTVEEVKPIDPKDIPAEVQAATFLTQALPQVRMLLNSGKIMGVHAKKILEDLICTPLEDRRHTLTSPEAEGLYELGLQITNAKFILFNRALESEKQKGTTDINQLVGEDNGKENLDQSGQRTEEQQTSS
jgi:hypothetical protein